MKYRFYRAVGTWRHGRDVMCGLCTAFSSAFWCGIPW